MQLPEGTTPSRLLVRVAIAAAILLLLFILWPFYVGK